jgi:hypothetical protein
VHVFQRFFRAQRRCARRSSVRVHLSPLREMRAAKSDSANELHAAKFTAPRVCFMCIYTHEFHQSFFEKYAVFLGKTLVY